jgi:tRNA (mo5U34)-methyltransferase
VSRDGEAGQNIEDVQRRVDELGWWYHHFELPSGVWTGTGEPPAYDPVERWELFEPHLPDDLEGKSVLDVGGNSGYFSLRMKQRGAGRCLMVEPVVEFVDQATFVFEQFGVEVDVVCEDVHAYCLTTDERFDYVLFLGLFYHLKYPVLVLDRLAEMTKELMIFNSHIEGIPPEAPAVDETAPSALGRMRRSVAKRLGRSQGDVARETADVDRDELQSPSFPRMSFLEGAYRGDLSNWWVPNYEALEPLARSAGLKVLARPHPEMLVAEPERYFGTARYGELVFPRYGKAEGGPVFPGEQRVFVEEVSTARAYQARLRATR